MIIDWFTVVAQALNFLILVWLMKRFLYKPILNAIDAREKRVASELADAASKQADAKKEREGYQKKNEEFDNQRAALLTKATDEASVEKQRLIGEARKAADAMSSKRMEALLNDAKNLNQAITRRTQDEVFSIARKSLADLADTRLEKCMVDVLTRRLRAMDGQAKSDLGDALSSNNVVILRSAFELPDEQRADIQSAISETFSTDVLLQFETSPELVSGIELTAGGARIAWSIADYLTSLEKGVGELLKAKTNPESAPVAKAGTKAELQPVATRP